MELNGRYLGFSGIDETKWHAGELEITISGEVVDYRFANGRTIITKTSPRSMLQELSPDEITAYFAGFDPRNMYVTPESRGFRVGEDGMVLIFIGANPELPAVLPDVLLLRLISDQADLIFGIGRLFSPAKVAGGYYEEALRYFDAQGIADGLGPVPRLDG